METHSHDRALSDRLLKLLDKAYEAPFKPQNFNELINSAYDLYFEDWDSAAVKDDIKQSDGSDVVLSSHLDRIDRLLQDRELENRAHAANLAEPSLAVLLIDPETDFCEGNHQAAVFFDHKFPKQLRELNLCEQSIKTLTGLATKTKGVVEFNNQITLLKRRGSETPIIAKCALWIKPDKNERNQSRGLAVSIAHFEWSPEMIQFCQEMFKLSPSETDVLAGLLNGQSQSEIANLRGRSVETIKVQSKAILRKSGCAKINDLVILATTYGLLADPGSLDENAANKSTYDFSKPDRTFFADDGRSVSYGIFGAPKGKPVLFVHGLVHGPFFPTDMIHAFTQNNIQIIAPSRPGFGLSDKPLDWKLFDQTVIEDAVNLVKSITDKPLTIIAHQGGVSHACRIAGALKGQTKNMVMIGAGIPIDEKRHLVAMGLQTRVAAMAVKYTPRLLETMIRIAIANELRKGLRPYLEHLLSNSPKDLELLDDPRIYPICEAGILHMIDQGAKPMVYDGKAAMSPWDDDYLSLTCPINWVHGTQDPIMRHDFVVDYVSANRGDPVQLVEGGANTMHLAHSQICLDAIFSAVYDEPSSKQG